MIRFNVWRYQSGRTSLRRRAVPSSDKLQDRHLLQSLTMLMQGGFKVVKDGVQFVTTGYESLGTQFTDAIF